MFLRRSQQGVIRPSAWSAVRRGAAKTRHLRSLALEQLETRTLLSFLPPVTFPTASAPAGVAVGDFNGDGKPDLVSANPNGSVSVLLGNGDGTFQSARNYAAGATPWAVAVGDFNGDGKLDIVVANRGLDGPPSVSVLLGNGDGTFRPAQNYNVGAGAYSVAVGDFRHIGVLDLVTANASAGSLSVLLGNGDGTFQSAVTYSVGSTPQSVTVGDFRNIGILDLAVAEDQGVGVLLGNGDGTFQPQTIYLAGSYPTSVAVGDFRNIGVRDLVVANEQDQAVSVLLGNGDGTFRFRVNYFILGEFSTSVAVADFNNDGNADLVVGNRNSSNVSVLLGRGDGTFQGVGNYAAGQSPTSLAVGDFNGDTFPDLVVGGLASSNVSVLIYAADWPLGPTAPERMPISVSSVSDNINEEPTVVVAPTAATVPPGSAYIYEDFIFAAAARKDSRLAERARVAVLVENALDELPCLQVEP